jgi:hypothetical protein
MIRLSTILAALLWISCSPSNGQSATSASEQQVLAFRAAVAVGDRASVRALFALDADGAAAEDKDIVLGGLIRVHPRLFLQELRRSGHGNCRPCLEGILGNLGDEFVDRFAAQAEELGKRRQALLSVADKDLAPLRDACIRVLDDQIRQADEQAR